MKALSPIIGIVLLVGISLGIFMILFEWSTSYVESSQEKSESKLSESFECMNAYIKIDYVIYNATSGNFSIVLENRGSVDFEKIIFSFIKDIEVKEYEVNEVLKKGEKKVYEINLNKACDIKLIRVSTQCSNAKDEIDRKEITFLGC
ncbi:MAG TPA: hypothetical protein EYH56_01495 [Nanoarchaeota archaeon]|nr:hypothetical protein [Nanoarchaeota archaeon]